MPSLPEDIIIDILSLLPVKSIVRFRCVSKHWCNNLLKDSGFAKIHLDRSIRNNTFYLISTKNNRLPDTSSACYSTLLSAVHEEPAVEIDSPLTLTSRLFRRQDELIYGSFNGLILMFNPWKRDAVILWNPSTKEIKEIPGSINVRSVCLGYLAHSDTIDYYSGSDESDYGYDSEGFFHHNYPYAVHTVCGFGYSHILDDYKIVVAKICYRCSNEICFGCEGCKVMVYSLRSNSWITIPDTIPYDLHLGDKIIKPVILNGDPHWLGSSVTKGQESSKASCIVIVSFDVAHDIFKVVSVIQELQESLFDLVKFSFRYAYLSRDIFLGSFNGCLSIVQGGELDMSKNKDDEISIWVMQEYGLRKSWIKMFCITSQLIERSINYSKMTLKDIKNGVMMFGKDNSSLVIYDLKYGIARIMNDLSEDWFYADMYVESLVSLNSGVYLGQRELIDRPIFCEGMLTDGLISSDDDIDMLFEL